MDAICERCCTYNGNFYKKGDVLRVPDDSACPAHFSFPGEGGALAGEPLPVVASNTAVILGDAPSFDDDADVVMPQLDSPYVVAVNHAPFRWMFPVDMWCSLHGSVLFELNRAWLRTRIGPRPALVTGRRWPMLKSSYIHMAGIGGSALLALLAVKRMGFERVGLIGVGLEGRYKNFFRDFSGVVQSMRRNGVEFVTASGAIHKQLNGG